MTDFIRGENGLPNIYEYVRLAVAAYAEYEFRQTDERNVPIPNWAVVKDWNHIELFIRDDNDQPAVITAPLYNQSLQAYMNEDTGYYGTVFFDPDTDQIVITHRGTDGSSEGERDWSAFWNDVFGDNLEIAFGNVPDQAADALAFTQAVSEATGVPMSDIHHTGQSLGAVLAQLTAIRTQSVSVTFDNPGVAPMLSQLGIAAGSPENHLVFNTAPNVVNMHNAQFGRVYFFGRSFDETGGLMTNERGQIRRSLGEYDGIMHSPTAGTHRGGDYPNNPMISDFNPETGWPREFMDMGINNGHQQFFAALKPFDQLPYYYWQRALRQMDAFRREEFIKRHLGGVQLDAATTSQPGLKLDGDDDANHFQSDTMRAEVMRGFKGNDTYFSFGGHDRMEDTGGSDTYTIIVPPGCAGFASDHR